ncbi:MAG: cyclic pyranopterin monophosphate synthase MoaC [Phycisphaeraceae bacterium]|nr:cyclic pyranopterin monophosphate synthase MoaC [Phycisphaeraceae bacterium]
MVDVGDKPLTRRIAVAEGYIRCSPELLDRIARNDLEKGSVFQIARIAGIQAAKRTDELIPLCHGLPLDAVQVDLSIEAGRIAIRAHAHTTWKTGVEMEALTAVTVAALTVIDMGKAIDRTMIIEGVRLLSKSGGRSGTFQAGPPQ